MTESQFWRDKNIVITGGKGFLGSQVVERLHATRNLPPSHLILPQRAEADLRSIDNCKRIMKGSELVIHLAATVGGIGYNQRNPALLFYDNIQMGINMIEAARQEGVGKFVLIGTVCAYPKYTPVPFKEDMLWDGYPEETNAPYGIAKKALLVMAQAYRQQYAMDIIYLLPVNLYGPRDDFDLANSHVIPALIRKFVDASDNDLPSVTAWGTGKASREFLYVDDAAEAIILAAEKYDKADPVNLGSGTEITIRSLTELVAELTGFKGEIMWDSSKPDGQPRRSLDITRAEREFGFKATTGLTAGLQKTISWYRSAEGERRT